MRFEIERERVVFDDTFKVVEAEVRWEQADGEMSPVRTRKKFDRGDAAAALVHDVAAGEIIFVRQFRYPAAGKADPWLLEIVAGKIDPGETAEEAIRREIREEIGLEAESLVRIAETFPSPGILSEKISIFYAQVSNARLGAQSLDEGEDARVERLPVAEAIEMAERMKIKDAKTLIGLFWLRGRGGGDGG